MNRDEHLTWCKQRALEYVAPLLSLYRALTETELVAGDGYVILKIRGMAHGYYDTRWQVYSDEKPYDIATFTTKTDAEDYLAWRMACIGVNPWNILPDNKRSLKCNKCGTELHFDMRGLVESPAWDGERYRHATPASGMQFGMESSGTAKFDDYAMVTHANGASHAANLNCQLCESLDACSHHYCLNNDHLCCKCGDTR